MRVRRGGSLESNCKIRWRISGASTSSVGLSGREVRQAGVSTLRRTGVRRSRAGHFHNLSEIRRILYFFPCKATGRERRVVLGLGGFQEAAPIYRNPVAKSRRACARALCCRRGPTPYGGKPSCREQVSSRGQAEGKIKDSQHQQF